MTISEIQKRFPHFTVRSEPDVDCTVCKGRGIVRTKSDLVPERPCLCVCLSDDTDTPSRSECAESLQRTIQQMRTTEHEPNGE
jgi:hypothetical protein